jgi:ubiquinone/menaquinone biosynthesis C-methylase UbiE
MRLLHFAPEPFFTKYFKSRVKSYETADLYMKGVDHKINMTNIPFPDESYDFIYASHVLEHIKDDEKAIKEIARILTPGGIAILHVPIVSKETVEYPEPCRYEAYHIRAPGIDYLSKYQLHFSSVIKYNSNDFDEIYQLFVYENRTVFPNMRIPFRPAMEGNRFGDCVPLCIK